MLPAEMQDGIITVPYAMQGPVINPRLCIMQGQQLRWNLPILSIRYCMIICPAVLSQEVPRMVQHPIRDGIMTEETHTDTDRGH